MQRYNCRLHSCTGPYYVYNRGGLMLFASMIRGKKNPIGATFVEQNDARASRKAYSKTLEKLQPDANEKCRYCR